MNTNNPRLFQNARGDLGPYDGVSPVTWRVSIYVLAVHDGKILMLEPGFAGRWELPGGEVLPNETLLEGAARECLEETGYRLNAKELVPVHFDEQFFFHRSKLTYHHAIILAVQGTVELERNEHLEHHIGNAYWVEPTTLTPDNTHPNHWPALQKAGVG